MNDNQPTIKILLVDDEERYRKAVIRLLRLRPSTADWAMSEAESGAAAMKALEQEAADCVLMDFGMPGGDGIEWMTTVHNRHPELPVVLVTGQGDEETAVRAMKEGAMDYLVKGALQPQDIERAVRNAIEKTRLVKEVESQRERLVEAERTRVMVESLGAACHHLGQPTTVLIASLELLRRGETDPQRLELLDECVKAANALAGIMGQLGRFRQYRTEPYIESADTASGASATRIVKL